MTLGDHLRYFADQCDLHPEWTAAGIVVIKDQEPLVQAFCETKDDPARQVAILINSAIVEPPEPGFFGEP